MIDVQRIWNLVKDLTRKDLQGGYMSNDEFNRQLNYCQEILFAYYYDHRNEQQARAALIAFGQTTDIPITNGIYVKPADYKEKMDAGLIADNGPPTPVHFPARDEWQNTIFSPIRKGSLVNASVIGKIFDAHIEISPVTTFALRLNYYRLLDQAVRAVTIDVASEDEVYDPVNTVHLMWSEEQLEDFVSVMMMMKGIIIRDDRLTAWVQAKRMITEQVTEA